MTQQNVLIVMNADARAFPPLTRLIGQYLARSRAVFFIGRSSKLFDERPLDISQDVARILSPISKSRYMRQFQNVFFFARVLAYGRSKKTTHIIVVDPPCRLLGLVLTLTGRVPVTYLEYDETAKGVSFRQVLVEAWMRLLARRAHAIIVPNQLRMTGFIERYKPSCAVVMLPNHPLRSEFIGVQEFTPFLPGQTLRLYYHGSFVQERMPLTLVHAMKIFSEFKLVLIPVCPDVVGGDLWLKTFLDEAKRAGVEGRVESFGFLSIEELKRLGSSCHVGISFYGYRGKNDTNLKSMWGASNKAVQYAAYGLAQICSTDELEMRSHLETGAIFCNMNDSASIAKAIRLFVKDPSMLNRMRSAIHSKAANDWTLEAAIEEKGVQNALAMVG